MVMEREPEARPDRPSAAEPPHGAGADVIAPGHTFGSITDKITAITQGQPASRRWWLGFGFTFLLVVMLHIAIAYLLVPRANQNRQDTRRATGLLVRL